MCSNSSYLGQDVNLPAATEEVAGFYAAMLETEHAKDQVFTKNFFEDFLAVLKKNPPVNRLFSCVCCCTYWGVSFAA